MTADATIRAGAEFGAALRCAIERSGLSLNEISHRLREQDTPVSVSALSYWQNGENRPERASSLAAVAALETILGQAPSTLTALLGPRRPRGRFTNRPGLALAYDQIWVRPDCVAKALAKVDATPQDLDTPHRLSQYVSYRVNAQGFEELMRVRRIVRADHDDTRQPAAALTANAKGALGRPFDSWRSNRPYSTVTLLARLRGLSTSVPFSTATRYASSCAGME